MILRFGSLSGQNRLLKLLGTGRKSKVAQEAIGGHAAVRAALEGPRLRAARTNYRVEQAARGKTVAKFEAVRDKTPDPEIVCQRAHHMLKPLADQHDISGAVRRYPFPHACHAFRLELLFQHIFEVFLTEQVQAVSRHPRQQRVENTSGENPVAGVGVQRRAHQGQGQHASPASPASDEGVRVPGEVCNRAHCAQVDQAPFHPPERQAAKVRL